MTLRLAVSGSSKRHGQGFQSLSLSSLATSVPTNPVHPNSQPISFNKYLNAVIILTCL